MSNFHAIPRHIKVLSHFVKLNDEVCTMNYELTSIQFSMHVAVLAAPSKSIVTLDRVG